MPGRYVKLNYTTNWGDPDWIAMSIIHVCDADGVKWNDGTMTYTSSTDGYELYGLPGDVAQAVEQENVFWDVHQPGWGGTTPNPGWWMVDLGESRLISIVKLKAYNGYHYRNIKDFTISVSDDGVNWTQILSAQTLLNEYDPQVQEFETSDTIDPGVTFNITELETYGLEVIAEEAMIGEEASVADFLDGLIDVLSEEVSVTDSIGGGILLTDGITEEVVVSDLFTVNQFDIEVFDELDLSELVGLGAHILSEALIDEFLLYDELKWGWRITGSDTLILTDDVSKVLGIAINEWLTLVDSQHNSWNGREIVPDGLTLYDVAVAARMYYEINNETLGITDVLTYKLTVKVLDLLGFAELSAAMKSVAETVSDSADLAEAVDRGFALFVSDTLAATDVSSVVALFLNLIAEFFDLAENVTPAKIIGVSANDPLVFTEIVTSKGTLYTAVYDTLALNVIVELAGDLWECYVLNTPKFHPSIYSGFDFNSFCVFENRAFGANDTGIFELVGATDAGATIHTGAILSETDFGLPNQKRFRRGYLGISGNNPVMVFETESGQREVYSIDMEGKIVVSSDLKSRSWKLSIADFDELSTVKLIPVILTK